ncbi:Heat shock 70 kDa protein 12A, partial [Nowakowskiella sp. JEL0407]
MAQPQQYPGQFAMASQPYPQTYPMQNYPQGYPQTYPQGYPPPGQPYPQPPYVQPYPQPTPPKSSIFSCCVPTPPVVYYQVPQAPPPAAEPPILTKSLPPQPQQLPQIPQTTQVSQSTGVGITTIQRRPNSAKSKFPNAKVVVGVDFGTTYSGFSFIMIPDDDSKPQRVHTFKDWRDQPPRTASAKTPTIINYFVKPGETVATHWGWTVDAITKEPQYHRVERCKLLLQESHSTAGSTSPSQSTFLNSTSIGSRSRESNLFLSETQYRSNEIEQKANIFSDIELPSGIQAVDVIANYLAFLFEVIKQEVSKILRSEGISDPLNVDQFVYCFTVPVFWSLAQQNTMREAVFKAKMISNFDSKNLMFCEEAVAGLLSFINMPAFNLHLPCDVLVLDAGGGTVDLFQCKILANKDVAEVTQADGGFFGSTLVDRYFWDFIKNTIGPHAYNELWNNPTLRTSKVDFINIWDGIKRSFDENESVWADEMMGGYKHINLSWELCKVIPQHILDTLPSSGEIRLQKHHLKSFFDPAIQEITKMVINQLDASGKTSYNQLDAL